MNDSNGTLYIVATPIGNLEDISIRALNTLRNVDLIAAEDTRHTRKLLTHFNIQKKLISFHDHSSPHKMDQLFALIVAGQSVAYVTDAGMPGISDPGFVIIRAARQQGIPIVIIPGPVAAMVGLVGSGLPMDRFVFEGFLPFKSGKRQNRLRDLAEEPRTLIFYESPHRLVKCLHDIRQVVGERPICIARELTKKFEEYVHGPISEVIDHFEKNPPKGEITVILAGKS